MGGAQRSRAPFPSTAFSAMGRALVSALAPRAMLCS